MQTYVSYCKNAKPRGVNGDYFLAERNMTSNANMEKHVAVFYHNPDREERYHHITCFGMICFQFSRSSRPGQIVTEVPM